MKSDKNRQTDKISYEKPTAADLGPTAPVVGASCGDGGAYEDGGTCWLVGNSADANCETTGNSAAGFCLQGIGGTVPN